jgi:hypothetical protein
MTALSSPSIAQERTAQSASLFVSRSAIALKIKVRSRAKSERAISKSDVPSSDNTNQHHTYTDD